jgi:hypothetical protein
MTAACAAEYALKIARWSFLTSPTIYDATRNTIGAYQPKITAGNRYPANGLVAPKYIQSQPEITINRVAQIARICHSAFRPEKTRSILRGIDFKKSLVRSVITLHQLLNRVISSVFPGFQADSISVFEA